MMLESKHEMPVEAEQRLALLHQSDNDVKNILHEVVSLRVERCRIRAGRSTWPNLWMLTVTFILAFSVLFGFVYLNSQARAFKSAQIGPGKLRDDADYILDPSLRSQDGPMTREYYWTIEEAILNPDGVFRPMLLINSTFPGPLIECNEGDEVIVHLTNHASNATSIHWHGIYQNGTNWMDGTVGVTQCPVAPGHSFTYRFNVSGQAGSYFYHSHMAMQSTDGLTGPFIIHPRSHGAEVVKSFDYVQDRVIMLSDHYYNPSSELLEGYLAPDRENDEPVPPSALINGRNLRDCSALPSRDCSTHNRHRASFDLSVDHYTRLRIINVGAFAEFSVQIDEHEFHVTEVDGVDVLPQTIHRLNINSAQRYSIMVKPRPDTSDRTFWLRARMINHCFAYDEPELQEEVRAIIRFKSFNDTEEEHAIASEMPMPQSRDWSDVIEVECRDLNTSALEPVIAVSAPTEVDHSIYLRSSFQIRDWALSRGYLNDSSFRIEPKTTVLDEMLQTSLSTDGGHPFHDGIDMKHLNTASQLVYRTSGILTVDVLIQNFDDGNHPFHLHGYKFWVLAQGHGYPPASHELYPSLDLRNPLRRDVVSVEAFGWTLLRFVADNPGVWAFHCHIGWHTEAGLMMVFANRLESMTASDIPSEVRTLCAMPGVERGMAPTDDKWTGHVD